MGWFADPIFSTDGNYPAVMRRRIDNLSREQGFATSRLPHFTAEQVQLIRGSSDYFGFNTYTSMRVARNDDYLNPANYSIPSEDHDTGLIFDYHPDWKIANSWWFAVSSTYLLPYSSYLPASCRNWSPLSSCKSSFNTHALSSSIVPPERTTCSSGSVPDTIIRK